MHRPPLTTTHPHGAVLVRPDRALGLLRISKNASTESKARLWCKDWIGFDEFDCPVVAFLREPVARFTSSVPETLLRMTHGLIAEADRADRVVIPQDIHAELMNVAHEPIDIVLETFIECVEYAFFDAHHEPQFAFMTNRSGALRIDPWLYRTEEFEAALAQIAARFGIAASTPQQRGNAGGAKPQSGRNPLVDAARRLSRSGVYRNVRHAGFLGARYKGSAGPIQLRDLNGLANRFTAELKAWDIPAHTRSRIAQLYDQDARLWQAVSEKGGDVQASEVWPLK